MKMSKPLFDTMNKAVTEFVHSNLEAVRTHRALELGKDIHVRFAWDILWASKIHLSLRDRLNTEELNDSHIQTAIMTIIKQLTAKGVI